jgi:hypothetical protein
LSAGMSADHQTRSCNGEFFTAFGTSELSLLVRLDSQSQYLDIGWV